MHSCTSDTNYTTFWLSTAGIVLLVLFWNKLIALFTSCWLWSTESNTETNSDNCPRIEFARFFTLSNYCLYWSISSPSSTLPYLNRSTSSLLLVVSNCSFWLLFSKYLSSFSQCLSVSLFLLFSYITKFSSFLVDSSCCSC